MINMVDEFVIYDIVQYTKNDWRNRNKIKTYQGLQWLTIPVFQASLSQLICDTKISNKKWNKKHWKTVQCNYSKTPFYKDNKDMIETWYLDCTSEYLSEINLVFIKKICKMLGINTTISSAADLQLRQGQTERLLDICIQKKADVYLSGPAAKDYLDESVFSKEKIAVEWMDYSDYPEYTQLYPPFEHGVTILDLIFNEGANANRYLKSCL